MKSFGNKFMMVIVICVLTLTLDFNTTHAQSAIPDGSYQWTCQNMRVNGIDLNADCERMDGRWENTWLGNFPSCASEVWNMDGHLTCLPKGISSGSYLGSCTNISSNGSTLYALCKTRSGDWWNTNLANFRECSGDISNQDGILTCPMRSVNYPPAPQQPEGHWFIVRSYCEDAWSNWAYLDADACSLRDTPEFRALTSATVGLWRDISCTPTGAVRSSDNSTCNAQAGNVKNIRLAQ